MSKTKKTPQTHSKLVADAISAVFADLLATPDDQIAKAMVTRDDGFGSMLRYTGLFDSAKSGLSQEDVASAFDSKQFFGLSGSSSIDVLMVPHHGWLDLDLTVPAHSFLDTHVTFGQEIANSFITGVSSAGVYTGTASVGFYHYVPDTRKAVADFWTESFKSLEPSDGPYIISKDTTGLSLRVEDEELLSDLAEAA